MSSPVDLEALSKRLLNGGRVEEVIFELSHAQESDFQETSSRRAPILERCLKFLHTAASNRTYEYIPSILRFVRAANKIDEWLVSSSSIILPKLNNLYCTILAEADPGSQQNPGRVNVAISSRVRREVDAMKALSSVFDVCVGFCDLVDEDNQEHLGIFLKTSAAVLFGSDFQKKRNTLNETDYAMDELARYSSYALSNIMLTYPTVVPMAEVILGKRLQYLFKFLHSSPEMSINRSLILMLRSLYDRYEKERACSQPRRDMIDKEFSYQGPGRRSVICLFQKIDLTSEDADAQAENVSMKMHSGDNSEACFKSVNCSVQVKEQSGASRYRVPFRSASVDWNRNSFVIHRPGDLPECWPLFLVSYFDWKKGRKELHLQIEQCSERKARRIVVRFSTQSASEAMKNIIQDRLRVVKEIIPSSEDRQHSFSTRKASLVDTKGISTRSMQAVTADISRKEGLATEGETVTTGMKPSSRVGVEHILLAVEPHRVFSSGSHATDDDDIGKSTLSSSTERYTPTQREPESCGTSRTNSDSRRSYPFFGPGDCTLPNDEKIDASPKRRVSLEGSIENHSSSGGSNRTGNSREVNLSSTGQDLGNDCDEKASKGQSQPSGIPLQACEAGRFDMMTEKKRDSYSQRKVTEHSVGKQAEREITGRKVTAPACVSTGTVNGLTQEDEQLRHKLHSIVARMLQWKRKQFSKVRQDTKLSIARARERCEKQDHELLTVFANGVRQRSALHTRKVATCAGQAKEVLLKTRKRLVSLREKLMDGQRQLKILKTKSAKDITHARDSMRQEREGLRVNLDQSVATSRRRGESRARKNSVLQSLTRILKR